MECPVARVNYQREKRQKDLARQRKQEEKRQKKLPKDQTPSSVEAPAAESLEEPTSPADSESDT